MSNYSTIHHRVFDKRGSAKDQICVKHAELGENIRADEWAQVHGTDGEDPWADYVPLCISCHRIYDRPHRTARWHAHNQRISKLITDLNIRRTGIPLSPEHRAKVISGKVKLTESIVSECRIRHAAGERICDLSREFGVAQVTMFKALNRITWQHVP